MKNPTIGKNVYIAEGAVVRGDVTIGNESSVWFNAVIRADREPVVIGRGTNIQDNSVVHVDDGSRRRDRKPCDSRSQCCRSRMYHRRQLSDRYERGDYEQCGDRKKLYRRRMRSGHTECSHSRRLTPAMGCPAAVTRMLTPEEIASNTDNARHYVQEAAAYGREDRIHPKKQIQKQPYHE